MDYIENPIKYFQKEVERLKYINIDPILLENSNEMKNVYEILKKIL
jgi:hypothetical protein